MIILIIANDVNTKQFDLLLSVYDKNNVTSNCIVTYTLL